MALFCMVRKPIFVQVFTRHVKVNYSQFHTLRKLDKNRLITRAFPTELVSPKRNYFWIFKKKTKGEIRLVDNPPDNYELIYRFPVDNYFFAFQHIGFYSAVIVCLVTLLRFHKRQDHVSEELDFHKIRMPKEENEVLLFVAAFFLVFFILHFFYNRLPMRIYCYPQKQKYLFYYYGLVPNQIKVQEIKVGTLKHKPEEGKLTPWGEKTYECKETWQKFILFEDHFRYPVDLHIMLGWHKDPDINYNYKEPEESKKIENKNK